jgi:hypothetical protein
MRTLVPDWWPLRSEPRERSDNGPNGAIGALVGALYAVKLTASGHQPDITDTGTLRVQTKSTARIWTLPVIRAAYPF